MQWIQNLRLTQKMMLAFGIVLVLMLVQGIASFIGLKSLNGVTREMADNTLPSVSTAGALRGLIGEYRATNFTTLVRASDTVKNDARARAGRIHADIDKAIAAYKPLISTAAERKAYEAFVADWGKAYKSYQDVNEMLELDLQDDAIDTFIGGTWDAHAKAAASLDALLKEVSRQTTVTAKDSATTYTASSSMVLVMLLAGIVGGLALAWFFARAIARAVGEAVRVANDVSRGKLDGTIDTSRKDEVGELLTSMQRMQHQVQAVIAAQSEMAQRHEEGSISYRMDDSAFPGEYGRMVRDTNALVASHLEAIGSAQRIMQRYAIGDLSPDMERLPGEKATLTETMDATKASLSAINIEIKRLASAAAAGDFSQRGDVDRYQYDFRDMVAGLNQLMETTDGNLAQVSTLLQAIARGDL
ncbi:MCP four helix bundle domain-containing protein, partial [Pseudoxanthomonas sp.]|uniref:MCP four helix bundle domain-containing protein n=1 Tax=Pseudoxanthomonas sp. TaxID=1871049 RepID=UPI003F7FF1FC